MNLREAKILVVDDTSASRILLVNIIKHAGGNLPYSAGTLADAKNQLTEKTIDIVFLDIQMPDGCGIDLLKDIRTEHPNIQVVMCTSDSTMETINRVMELEVSGYLVKPLTTNSVVKATAIALKNINKLHHEGKKKSANES